MIKKTTKEITVRQILDDELSADVNLNTKLVLLVEHENEMNEQKDISSNLVLELMKEHQEELKRIQKEIMYKIEELLKDIDVEYDIWIKFKRDIDDVFGVGVQK